MLHLILSVALAGDPLEAGEFASAPNLGNHSPTIHPIINGDDADEDDFPMSGGMLFSGQIFGYQLDSFMCSSTLIAPDVVLLAGHCVDLELLGYGYEVEDPHFYWTREANLTEWDGMHRDPELPDGTVEAREWVAHDEWSINNLSSRGLAENFDIALLFLEEPVTSVPFAYLPTPDEATQLDEGDEVTVVGWGQQSATAQGQPPPAGSFAIKKMGVSFINEIDAFEMQIGAAEDDVRKCHGDSGGPSFMEVETDSRETWRVVGVTSHAYDETDCNEKGGVDTRVDRYLEWIDDEMRARCEDGSRVWCEEEGIPEIPEPIVDTDGDGIPDDEEDEDEDGIPDNIDPKIKKGCGCETAVPGATGLLPLAALGLLLLRRRRSL